MRRALPAAALSAGLLLSAPAPASAQPADEHAAASAILAQLAGDGAAGAGHRELTADPVREAKDALERATRLRVAGDEAHAKAADGLALEWAETARDLVRAADAEAAAADLRRKALEAQAQLERSRAMVEEAIASIGRLQAELDQITKGAGKAAPHTAVEVHDGQPAPPKKASKKDAGGTP